MRLWRTPLDTDTIKKPKAKIGLIPKRCKGCTLCVTYCPRDVLVMSDELNLKGYHLPAVKDIDSCLVCGLCELLCPEFALYCLDISAGAGDGV